MSKGQHHYIRPAPFNAGGTFHDGPLRELARSFLKLAPFPDADFDRGQEYVMGDGMPKKHVARFPNMDKYGVYHHIKGQKRFIAYASEKQMDDALRFADATTHRFWKYRTRQPDLIDEKQFNFSIAATEADLADWVDTAPEIIYLIDDIEKHFLEAGVFVAPEERVNSASIHSKSARRTIAGELRSSVASIENNADNRHQELLDILAGVCERLDVIEKRVTANPNWASPVTVTGAGWPADHIDELQGNDELP